MAVTRLPVYPWALPKPGIGALAAVERAGARAANRCAVGTSLWKRWREERTPDVSIVAEPVTGD